MTTIAYTKSVLAADKQRVIRGTPITCTKIFKAADGSLYGCAGDSSQSEAFKQWHADGANGVMPPIDKLDILHVDVKGWIWHASESLRWIPIPLPYWAVGSGADYAMGAMAAGKSASRAVDIACTLDANSGMGIDTLILGPFDE